MRRLTATPCISVLFVLFVLFAVAACTSVTAEPDAGGISADTQGIVEDTHLDSSTEDTALPPAPTVHVQGRALNLVAESVIEGMEVCLYESVEGPCALTDSEGRFDLPGVPAESDVILAYRRDGYFPELVMVRTALQDVVFPLTSAHATTVEAEAVPRIVGQTRDQSKGHVGFAVFRTQDVNGADEMLPGAQLSLVTGGDVSPVYLLAAGVPDAALTETTENARAFFFNLEPGEVVVRVTHPTAGGCAVFGFGWPGPEPGTVRLKVEAGHVTAGAVICDQ